MARRWEDVREGLDLDEEAVAREREQLREATLEHRVRAAQRRGGEDDDLRGQDDAQ